jgi:PAS domain S-box-containing protein
MSQTIFQVLMIEDEPADVLLVKENLDPDHYAEFQITHVERLVDGLDKARSQKFDVILLDLGLPDSQGLVTFNRMHEQIPDVPVLVLSGKRDEQIAIQSVQAGAQDYLLKDEMNGAILARAIRYAIERQRAQTTWHAQEQRLQLFTNYSRDIMLLIRQSDGRVLEANTAALTAYGYSRDELLNLTVYDLRVASREEISCHLIQAGQDGVLIETIHRRKDGTTFPVEAGVRGIVIDGEKILLANLRDITNRKKAEQELEHRNHELQILYEAGRKLSSTLDVGKICEIIHEFISRTMACNSLIVSSFNPADQMIRCLYSWIEGESSSVANLPPIPLPPEGKGTQSIVIRSGKPLYIADFDAQRKKSMSVFYFDEKGERVVKADEMPADSEHPRSAILVPLKLGDQVVGVIQVFSYRLADYGENDLRLLEALAAHASAAITNAQLYQQAQEQIAQRQMAERAYHEKESHYHMLAEHTSDTVWLMDMDFRILFISPSVTRLRGYTLAELNAMPLDQQMTPDSLIRVMQIFSQAVSDENLTSPNPRLNYSIDLEYYRKDGSWFWSENSFTLILNDQGKPVNILASGRDITERKRAEDALRASEAKFRQVVQELTTGYFLTDQNGKITEWNRAMAEITGIPSAQAIGKYSWDIQWALMLPEYQFAYAYEEVKRKIIYMLQSGNAHRPDKPMTYTILNANGERREIIHVSYSFQTTAGLWVGNQMRDVTVEKIATNALRESEEKYRTLVEHLESSIVLADADGVFHFMNGVAAKLLGGTVSTLVGKTMYELFPSQVAEHQMQRLRGVLANNAGAVWEEPTVLQGQWYWYRTVIQPLPQAEGKPTLAIVIATDITERKETERILEERVAQRTAEIESTRRRLELAAQAADLGIWEWNIQTGESLWDERTCAIFGVPIELTPISDESFVRLIHPADLANVEESFQTTYTDERRYYTEYRIVRPGNDVRHVRSYAQSVLDAEGNVERIVGVIQDVTAQKRAEQILRESEEQNRLLFEESPDPTILLDTSGRFVRVNRAFQVITNLAPEQMLGRTSLELGLITPEVNERFQKNILQSVAQRTSSTIGEYPFRVAGGAIREIETRMFALTFQGAPHILSTIRDITERKNVEQALRLANAEMERAMRVKDEFLATMSHELRTPLNAILGLSQGLQERAVGPLNDKQLKALNTIETSGQHLLELINDILDLSKIEAGAVTLTMGSVSVSSVCEDSLLFVRETALKKNIKLSWHYDTAVEWITADERRVKQMLVNLLSNAVKFTPSGGQVGLETQGDVDGKLLRFIVWDTGIGVAEQDLGRLFKPFVQLDSSLSRRYEGTGLGLSLVARMVEMHGGSVSVTSEVGKGSRFVITLPWSEEMNTNPGLVLATDEYKATPFEVSVSSSEIAPQPPDTQSPLILIAEDNEASALTVSTYLQFTGYRVSIAQDGIETIERARNEHPVLILMDIQMPTMDGLEATRRLRQDTDPVVAHVPIVALTALAMPGDHERCIAAGANFYLTKPVHFKQLIGIIQQLVGKKP